MLWVSRDWRIGFSPFLTHIDHAHAIAALLNWVPFLRPKHLTTLKCAPRCMYEKESDSISGCNFAAVAAVKLVVLDELVAFPSLLRFRV